MGNDAHDSLRRLMESAGVDPEQVARDAEEIDLDAPPTAEDFGKPWRDYPEAQPPEPESEQTVLDLPQGCARCGDRGLVDDPETGQTTKCPCRVGLLDPGYADIGQFHRPESGAPETERLAAIQQYPKAGTDRRKVLDVLALASELTDDEIAAIAGLRRYAAAPRRNELVSMGWVEDSGVRRPTDSGSLATAWRLTEAGRRLYPKLAA